MDWSKNTWEIEDKLYSPKRKVNNRKSHFIPHLSGYLYSHKMNRQVGYESFWGECLFYFYLELDPETIRYYEQPVEVPIVNLTVDNEINVWPHVPDVLVFRQGNKPMLFQIKGADNEIEQNSLIELRCKEFAFDNNWVYNTIQPKKLPEILKSNILFLSNYLKPRTYYAKWEQELIQKVAYYSEVPILELAKGFSSKEDFRFILPLIYHLIAKGKLMTRITDDINEKSVVQIGNINESFNNFLEWGV